MLPAPSYVPLDDTNRQHLDHVIRVRWRKQRKTLLLSFSLPLLFGAIPAVFVTLTRWNVLNVPDTISVFLQALAFLCYPVLLIVVVANVSLIIGRFRLLYIDRKNGKKLRIPFHPHPYCIPELGRFYVKTNISRHPFIPIDQETYYWLNEDQVLYMDLAPKSKILFDIKTDYDLGIIPLAEEITTPSQVKERMRQ
jgi:hypothetical protein